MKFFRNGKAFEPEYDKICVLYDPQNGQVIHIHEVVIPPGGRKVDDNGVETRTFQQAANLGKDTSKLKALHVLPKDIERGSPYKVDLKSIKLVKIQRAKEQ